MNGCVLGSDLRERRDDPEDARLDVAAPPICIYHRDDGHRLTLTAESQGVVRNWDATPREPAQK